MSRLHRWLSANWCHLVIVVVVMLALHVAYRLGHADGFADGSIQMRDAIMGAISRIADAAP